MAKSSNPMDAHRKAQRQKELKRNKQTRQKQREVATVKKDTRPIEAEIRKLSQLAQNGPLSKTNKDELASLRAELARITKAKQDYVEAHPEHRKFVFPDRPSSNQDETGAGAGSGGDPPGLYDKNGRLKHPERSVYYDPVFNPFGAPPPGMPYREKPEFAMQRMGVPTPEELAAFHAALPGDDDELSDEAGEDDDDIAMPAGPPPAASESDSSEVSDDDDIPLPPGPPPPQPGTQSAASSSRVNIPRPSSSNLPRQPFPPRPSHPQHPHALPPRPAFLPPQPQLPHPHPHPHLPPPPNGPSGPRIPHLPARPAPPSQHMSDPLALDGAGPQKAFQQGRGPIGPSFPPPPPASFSANISAAPSPFLPLGGPSASSASTATISAAPVLRDLKKEATAFLPSAMRKKQAQKAAQHAKVGLGRIDAARGASDAGGEEGERERKPSLMEAMKGRGIGVGGPAAPGMPQGQVLPPPSSAAREGGKKNDQGIEDYKRFEEEMKDFL
ncbi:hypothetical protein JCM21900_000989 [Sporobolomyces salmonicolor]